jgi:hypothetical protein
MARCSSSLLPRIAIGVGGSGRLDRREHCIQDLARYVRLFLGLNEFTRGRYIHGGFPTDKIRVKPNFAPDPGLRERPPSASRTVLFVGRLSRQKGLEVVLDAWRTLGEEDLQLLVVGDGPLRAELEGASPPSVRFRRQVPPDEVERLMLRSRALVFPSLSYEGQPMVVLEALASGLPVLASRLGGTQLCWRRPASDGSRRRVTRLPGRAGCGSCWTTMRSTAPARGSGSSTRTVSASRSAAGCSRTPTSPRAGGWRSGHPCCLAWRIDSVVPCPRSTRCRAAQLGCRRSGALQSDKTSASGSVSPACSEPNVADVKVWIGMPWQLLVYRIGPPNDLNSTTTALAIDSNGSTATRLRARAMSTWTTGRSPLIKRRESVEHAKEV